MQLRILILLTLFLSIEISAQTSGINYKAIIKDTNGDILVNSNIGVEFNILASSGQALVYSETHSTSTDMNGLIILTIGQGNTSDVFDDIQWERFEHYLNVKIDIGAGLVDMGTTEFMAAPYALQSDNANQAEVAIIANRLTLKSGTANQFTVTYDTPGDKLKITEVGVTGNVLEIKGGELYLPQYAGSDNRTLQVDATGKVISVINSLDLKYNRFEFTEKEVFPDFTKLTKGIQLPDGTELSGIKSFLMDNNTTGSSGVGNTAFSGIYRTSRTSNTIIEPIYRIDGSDTPTDQFVEFTQTTLATTGSNIIDNANYIYLLQVFYCNDCLVTEVTLLQN